MDRGMLGGFPPSAPLGEEIGVGGVRNAAPPNTFLPGLPSPGTSFSHPVPGKAAERSALALATVSLLSLQQNGPAQAQQLFMEGLA